MEKLIEIDPCRLCTGLYVHLDLCWTDHPFPLSRFKIKTDKQVLTLRSLGLSTIRYCPERSDVEPLPEIPAALPNDSAATSPEVASEIDALMEEKRQRRQHLEQHRTKIAECQRTLALSAQTMRKINADVFTHPQASVGAASAMIDDIVEKLLADTDTVLYSVNDKVAGEEIYNHSVNVAVLATLLAKELGYAAEVIAQVGVGCLFHDIGLLQIPSRVTMKTEPLTAAEHALLQEHCGYGEKIALDIGLSSTAINIIKQHHEFLDGSGYPNRLRGSEIFQFAQLVAIVEIYDQLCNAPNPSNSHTPHEALSQLFAMYRAKLDSTMLQAFIRFMGIYPPGSVVSLSNDSVGIVLSVTSHKPLKPTLMVYDPQIPKEEALLLDLSTVPEINITRAIRPSLMAPEIFEYLAPRKRAAYFFGACKRST